MSFLFSLPSGIIAFANFMLLTVYFSDAHSSLRQNDLSCRNITISRRLNCLPLKNVTKELCSASNCCWDETFKESHTSIVPRCFFSRRSERYQVTSIVKTKYGIEAHLQFLGSDIYFPRNIYKLSVIITYCDERRIRIKITDPVVARYEVPLPLSSKCSSRISPYSLYDTELLKNGTFLIRRKSSGYVIFSVDLSFMVFADQFLQLSVGLPSHLIYGLGDHLGPLLKNTDWQRYTFFDRDEIPKENMNLYSSFPFYMVMESGYNSHGVYFFNSNAMDVILQPAPAITFRSTGGVFDFFVFMGPSPNDVVKQFTQIIGYPAMPPYWSLGFHLCRLGYFTLNKTMEVLQRTVAAGIPVDTQWNDIDCMENYNDFTYDKKNFAGLPDFVQKLHQQGRHYVLIVDPGISGGEKPGTYPPFDEGMAMNIFVKNASKQLAQTKAWNKVSTVFPDFLNPAAGKYWEKQLSDFHSRVPFDGIWLDMNEPTSFLNGSFWGCPKNSSLDNPPYSPGIDALYTKTICMSSQHYVYSHYNVHNIYGTYETEATYRALEKIQNKRPFILTRAGFPGIGRFAAMWNGDVISIWEHMKASIPSILGYSMAGIPMIGADICGFNDNTTVELCARWFTLGAFYPFCRNHNSDENIEQDPVALGPVVVSAAKSALSVRYYLLPYLYTLLYFSHVHGDVVAKPLFFEYPNDASTYNIDTQFLWGSGLMILPALEPGVNKVTGYFPHDVWYDFYTGIKWKSLGQNFTLDAPLHKINLAMRGGFIIPAQEPSNTTTESRSNKYALLVPLNSEGKAKGYLFSDDGESLDISKTKAYNLLAFTATDNHLNSTLFQTGLKVAMTLGEVKVFGVARKPKSVVVNGQSTSFSYKGSTQVLHIRSLKTSLLKPLDIRW